MQRRLDLVTKWTRLMQMPGKVTFSNVKISRLEAGEIVMPSPKIKRSGA